MNSIKNVRFNFQCDKDLNQMKPCAEGYFCTGCHKTVLDFRNKNKTELADVLARQTAVCGIFDSSQLAKARPVFYRRLPKWMFGILLALGLGTLHKKLVAQNTVPTDSVKKRSVKNGMPRHVFGMIATLPRYKHGDWKAMSAFLKKHIHDPKEVVPKTVVVTFVIDTTGKVVSPRIINSINKAVDTEILQAVKLLEFEPQKILGKKVSCMYSLPIRFPRK